MASHGKLFGAPLPRLVLVHNSELMKTFSKIAGVLLIAGLARSVTAFTYSDTDLLLVFRKTGNADVLFNLGSISNYLGQANGTTSAITNWDFNRV